MRTVDLNNIRAESKYGPVLGLSTGHMRLPWWLSGKSICLQCGRPGFDPWVGIHRTYKAKYLSINRQYMQLDANTTIGRAQEWAPAGLKTTSRTLQNCPETAPGTAECRTQGCNSEPGVRASCCHCHHRHSLCHNCPLTTGWWAMECCPGLVAGQACTHSPKEEEGSLPPSKCF